MQMPLRLPLESLVKETVQPLHSLHFASDLETLTQGLPSPPLGQAIVVAVVEQTVADLVPLEAAEQQGAAEQFAFVRAAVEQTVAG